MNRESAFGEFLDANGYSKFDGMGFGMFQVDKRYHTPKGGPTDWHHIDQAMDIYKGYIGQIKGKHPGWSEEEYLAAGLVAYNSGPGNAQTRPSSTAAWAQLAILYRRRTPAAMRAARLAVLLVACVPVVAAAWTWSGARAAVELLAARTHQELHMHLASGGYLLALGFVAMCTGALRLGVARRARASSIPGPPTA